MSYIRMISSKDDTKSIIFNPDNEYFIMTMVNPKYSEKVERIKIHKEYIKDMLDMFTELNIINEVSQVFNVENKTK